tara:strand:- start:45 stop:416 length:372 start_codon:yes stop_codon:yes gene_type:complete
MSIGEEIANKDLILSKIENEIKNQQNFILSQLTDIEKKRKSNQYLNSIYEDYMKFKEYIVKEKTEQKMVMQKLLSYLEKSKMEEYYASRLIDQLNIEEKNVQQKLNDIKSDLNELIGYKNNNE